MPLFFEWENRRRYLILITHEAKVQRIWWHPRACGWRCAHHPSSATLINVVKDDRRVLTTGVMRKCTAMGSERQCPLIQKLQLVRRRCLDRVYHAHATGSPANAFLPLWVQGRDSIEGTNALATTWSPHQSAVRTRVRTSPDGTWALRDVAWLCGAHESSKRTR